MGAQAVASSTTIDIIVIRFIVGVSKSMFYRSKDDYIWEKFQSKQARILPPVSLITQLFKIISKLMFKVLV
jgi:hypothetical protein